MARTSKKEESVEIHVLKMDTGEMTFHLVGTTPMLCHRIAEKALQELLLPKGRQNKAALEQTLKHEPLEEYRNSPYKFLDNTQPTRIYHPAGAFKKILRTMGTVMPGVDGTTIGRLTWIKGTNIPIFGIPRLRIDVPRLNNPAKTPDPRTRAEIVQWACSVPVQFVRPQLIEESVAHLMMGGGMICGVGDWRQEKGSGNFGQFRVVEKDDPEFLEIIATGGRVAQDAALQDPDFSDDVTERLFHSFYTRLKQRQFKAKDEDEVPAPPKKRRGPPAGIWDNHAAPKKRAAKKQNGLGEAAR